MQKASYHRLELKKRNRRTREEHEILDLQLRTAVRNNARRREGARRGNAKTIARTNQIELELKKNQRSREEREISKLQPRTNARTNAKGDRRKNA